jgi:hypothetical protein
MDGMVAAVAVFITAFGATMWWTGDDPPGKAKIVGLIESQRQANKAPVDQHYSGCDAARADGRSNIPISDPSYRLGMDGDRDGLACEPHRSR